VLPGRVIREFIENDGIIGGITEASAEHAEAVYRVLLQGQTFRTDGSTAELVELAKNASTGGHRAVLVAHTACRRIPREELMRRVVIDTTGLTHQFS
jgi:UDP-N-acetyl-D-mannosaminuronate dehydrogenase